MLIFVASCASPKKTPTTKPTTQQVAPTIQANANTKAILTQALALEDSALIIERLVEASEQAIVENNYAQSLYLCNQIAKLSLSRDIYYQNQINTAKNLHLLDQTEAAAKLLADLVKESPPTTAYWQLLAEIKRQLKDDLGSVEAMLFALSANNSSIENTYQFWLNLSQLAQWQKQQFKSIRHPDVAGWYALDKLAANLNTTTNDLVQWQRQFSTHPANLIIDQVQSLLNTDNGELKHVAVLLPLSGREASLGHIVQQGILSAYQASPNTTVTFYDTNDQVMAELVNAINSTPTDFIIGPLLKRHVKAFVEHRHEDAIVTTLPTTPTTSNAFHIAPALMLNLTDDAQLPSNVAAFTLRPEDEAIQAADVLSRRGYKSPMVISHNSSVGKRVANEFVNRWRVLTGLEPILVLYDNADKMQDVVENILEVSASKQRINALENRINGKIYNLERNRRDIDMIYLFGNTTQTRLLKPFIDVNISPFAKEIPIFATSRSHSSKEDRNISRDLVGLTFTDMPWLIESKEQDRSLKAVSDELWPNRSDNLHRLFAMGFDSFHLVNKLTKMKQNPFIAHQGQTGLLALDRNNIIQRSLIWGKYRKGSVATIAMD